MATTRNWTRFERAGTLLSLVLLAVGIAELTELIDVLPTYVYPLVLWALAVSLWIHRRPRP